MAYPPGTQETDAVDGTPTPGVHAPRHDAVAAAINTIITELGTNPKGSAADLTARLATLAAAVTFAKTAFATLSGHRIVSPRSDGTVEYADNATSTHANRPFWMTSGAATSGAAVTVVAYGEITEPSWSWTPGAAVYLATNGTLTQTAPVAPAFLLQVGTAQAPTVMFIDPQRPIFLT